MITRGLQMGQQKLTKIVVDRLAPASTRYTIWDDRLRDSGVRVSSSGQKSFIVRYRPKDRVEKRNVTIGRYGVLTMDEAREHAKRTLGSVANGEDPAHHAVIRRQAPTLAHVAAEFLKHHVAAKRKQKTLLSYKHALS
jgi:Arm DNA-binding domain